MGKDAAELIHGGEILLRRCKQFFQSIKTGLNQFFNHRAADAFNIEPGDKNRQRNFPLGVQRAVHLFRRPLPHPLKCRQFFHGKCVEIGHGTDALHIEQTFNQQRAEILNIKGIDPFFYPVVNQLGAGGIGTVESGSFIAQLGTAAGTAIGLFDGYA